MKAKKSRGVKGTKSEFEYTATHYSSFFSPIISVEVGNKAQSYNIALSSSKNKNKNSRIKRKNRKRIILLLFFYYALSLSLWAFFAEEKHFFFSLRVIVCVWISRGKNKNIRKALFCYWFLPFFPIHNSLHRLHFSVMRKILYFILWVDIMATTHIMKFFLSDKKTFKFQECKNRNLHAHLNEFICRN